MKTSEIRKLSDEQLVHAELRTERELVGASFKHGVGQLDDTTTLLKLRRRIARFRTVQRERERKAGLNRDTLRNQYRATFTADGPAPEEASAGASKGFLRGIVDKITGKE